MFACYNVGMTRAFHNFTYDGTLEGLLCVYIKCISMKVRPLEIKPEFMVRGTSLEDRFLYVHTNPGMADRLYRYLGQCASAQIQQMVSDCFLTSLPRMEADLYELVCRAIRFGASISEDYEDETMHRIQMAIRDLYREAQSLIQKMDFHNESGVCVTSLNPRNCVLPLMRHHILNNPEYDDLLAYDKRHYLLLLRNGSEDDMIDIRRLPIPAVNNPHDIYEAFWPYVTGERDIRSSHQSRRIGGKSADGLDPLWHIA